MLLMQYGIFLAIVGTGGVAYHSWESDLMHIMYAGVGCFASISVCALLSASRKEVPVMIGVHLALVLIALFNIVFFMQAVKASTVPHHFDRLVLFAVMGGGSSLALSRAFTVKPKSKRLMD
mmetsp:Transcript_68045/g.122641  ORF Transcript_68045/g.122641 Transcript_68045/m.122641 type:complete len:121 (+) Transcript_68045:1-363(+)